jgi:hypothetical protein
MIQSRGFWCGFLAPLLTYGGFWYVFSALILTYGPSSSPSCWSQQWPYLHSSLFGRARGRDGGVREELAVSEGRGQAGWRLDSERFRSTPRTCGRFRGILSLQ